MLTMRRASTDEDLEAYRTVFQVILPDDRCPSVADLRRTLEHRSQRVLLIVREDGELVGTGLFDQSDEVGRAATSARVLPAYRRRGHGSVILEQLLDLARVAGFSRVGAGTDDDGSAEFARRHGFVETDRQVEQVRRIGDEPWPEPVPGIEVFSIEERPDLWERAFDEVALDTVGVMVASGEFHLVREEWAELWMDSPASTWAAVDGDLVVGVAGLMSPDRPGRAEHTFTGVRHDHRGRGIALLLKRMCLAWAAENGLDEVITWTQERNDGMRAVNEKLGFEYGIVSRRMTREL
jgi:GNAT superfamily N-acetyltransferase